MDTTSTPRPMPRLFLLPVRYRVVTDLGLFWVLRKVGDGEPHPIFHYPFRSASAAMNSLESYIRG